MRRARPTNFHTFKETQCCICGFENCFEATDHSSLPLSVLHRELKKFRKSHPQVDQLKRKVDAIYTKLHAKISNLIKFEHRKSLEWFNQFYFSGVDASKVNLPTFCQIISGDYSSLPNPRIKKWFSHLTQGPQSPE